MQHEHGQLLNNVPTGPGGRSGVSSPMPRRPRRHIERSCMVCHRRKVRCDKGYPCANCTRSGVLCCYPAGERAPRQPKTTIADIASRLVQLERTLVAVSGGGDGRESRESRETRKAPETREPVRPRSRPIRSSMSVDTVAGSNGGTSQSSPSTPQGDDETASNTEEILLKNSYQYINEVLMSRVLEEEEEIQSIMASQKDTEGTSGRDDSPAPGLGPALSLLRSVESSRFIGGPLASESLRPSKAQAIQLWQTYKHNVEPLNKILHVPTAEIQVYTAIDSPQTTSPGFSCLLFSIYFAAATSYHPEDYKAAFGEDKDVALDRFRTGLEYTLAQANFLEAPTVPCLQALTLFLRLTIAHSFGRSTWILYGTILRAAQSIGLHRDGDNFGLSPFEAEMRRRIWWHFNSHDARAAEDYGIAVHVLDYTSDTRFPLNVNDSDLDPDMTELPPERTGWSEMTLPLCMFRLTHAMQLVQEMLIGPSKAQLTAWANVSLPIPTSPPTEAQRVALFREHTAYPEQLIRQCNPVVPLQRISMLSLTVVLRKYDLISHLQLVTITASAAASVAAAAAAAAASPDGNGGRRPRVRAPQHASEEALESACEILELVRKIQTDPLLHNFRWSSESYPQYYVILYMLWHLCVKPVGNGDSKSTRLTERSWTAIEMAFASEMARQRRQLVGQDHVPGNSKWVMLVALRDKALRIRESAREKAAAAAAEASMAATMSAAAATADATIATAIAVAAETTTTNMAAATAMTTDAETAAEATGLVQPPELPDTDMTTLLGDSILDDANTAWEGDFLDWNALADGFQTRSFDFGAGF